MATATATEPAGVVGPAGDARGGGRWSDCLCWAERPFSGGGSEEGAGTAAGAAAGEGAANCGCCEMEGWWALKSGRAKPSTSIGSGE